MVQKFNRNPKNRLKSNRFKKTIRCFDFYVKITIFINPAEK